MRFISNQKIKGNLRGAVSPHESRRKTKPRRVIPTGLLPKKNRQRWRIKFWLLYGNFLVFMKMQASVIASI